MGIISIGKNNNFKCSHVLSFTALNVPTNGLLLDHPNVKCKSVPNIIIKIVLIISNFKIELFLDILVKLCHFPAGITIAKSSLAQF